MKTSHFVSQYLLLNPPAPFATPIFWARAMLALSLLALLSLWVPLQASTTKPTLENQAYRMTTDADGSLILLPKGGADEFRFRPEFTALVQTEPLAATPIKMPQPVYNLTSLLPDRRGR